MKKSQCLSVLLILAMLLALLPASAAAARETKADTDGIILNKTSTLADDGTYTIQMEAYSAGSVSEITQRNPTDIIIVMDVSGSMNDPDWAVEGGTASWQQYSGWFSTAKRLQDEGQTFYCNQHSDYYRVATLQKVDNVTSSSGVLCDVYGYYCSYCGTSRTYGGVAFSDYILVEDGGSDYLLGDNLDLYRKTSDITRIAAMQTAVNEFIETTAAENEGYEEAQQHRIALVKYAGNYFSSYEVGNQYHSAETADGTYYVGSYGASATEDDVTYYCTSNCAQILSESSYVNSTTSADIQSAVNGLKASGSTQSSWGLYLAYKVAMSNLETHPGRPQIILFFTDGVPTTTLEFEAEMANTTIANAKVLKESVGVQVYSVNMMPESASTTDMTKYMNYVSSNYPNAESLTVSGEAADTKYYKQVHDMADLNALFDDISNNISDTPVTLDGTAQLHDYMAEGFFLNDDTRVVVQTVEYNGNNTWKTPVTVQEYPANSAYADSPIQIHVNQEDGSIFVDGFSYKDEYIHEEYFSILGIVPAGGKKLIVTIYGVNATDEAIQNSYVDTNLGTSGIYSNNELTSSIFKEFPMPEVLLTSKTYVWDFGRPAFLSSADWHQSSVTHLGLSMGKFESPVTSQDLSYGLAAIDGSSSDGFSYYPKTMQWDGYDSLYAFGKDADNTQINTWAKINIIPANNVYYEDDFIAGSLNVEDGIVYTNGSKPEGMSDEEWEALQSGWTTTGNGDGSQEDPNGEVHGWISDLSEAAGHSDGAAHIVQAISGQTNSELPSARFTFTGTGMDIYSFTDSTTGTILVSVAKQGGSTQYYVVDNYAASGSYYQIPTVTFSGDHGTYDVTIYVTTAAASEERFTFYLDGIRVYNPLGSSFSEDGTVTGAYEGELNASFTEVRNILSAGAVFIDKDAEGNTSVEMDYNASDYALYAPEHEVYLDQNQSVTFAVADGSANYYVGLKALAGGSTTAQVGNGDTLASIAIAHTTDLYYKVTPYQDSATGKYVITIKNAGTSLLAITKVRQTSATDTELALSSLTAEEALAYNTIFESMEVVPYVVSSQVEQVHIQQPAPVKDEMTLLYEHLQRLTEALFADLSDWF